MKHVKVVADTTANVPPHLARELDIRIVPYCVQFDNDTFYEDELSRHEFHGRINGGVFPKTSQPPVGKFVEIFQEAAKDAAGLLCVTLTSAHSGGYGAAMAAKAFLPDVPIEVVDSKGVSMGSGFLALAAARAGAMGRSLADVTQMVERIRARMHHMIALDTLKYLQLGGRVSAFQTVLASMLSIKPILYVKDGTLLPYERVRTRARSLERIIEVTEEAIGADKPARIAVFHDQAEQDCLSVLETLKKKLNIIESFTGEVSLAITTHSGPGLVGIISYAVEPGEP